MFVEQRDNKTLITTDYVRDAISQIFFPGLKLSPKLLTYTEPLGMTQEQRSRYEDELRRGKKPYPRVYLRRSDEEEVFFVGSVIKDQARPADHILEPLMYEPLKTLEIRESKFIPEHNLIALVGYPYPTVGFPPYPIRILQSWKKGNESDRDFQERLKLGAKIVFKDSAPYAQGRYYWDIGEMVGKWLDYHFGAKSNHESPESQKGRMLFAKFASIYYVKTRFDHPDQFNEINILPSLPYDAPTEDPEELARRLAYAIEKSKPPFHKRPLEFFFEDFCSGVLQKLLKIPPEEMYEQLKGFDWAAVGKNIGRGAIALTESPIKATTRVLYEVALLSQRHLVSRIRKKKKKSPKV